MKLEMKSNKRKKGNSNKGIAFFIEVPGRVELP